MITRYIDMTGLWHDIPLGPIGMQSQRLSDKKSPWGSHLGLKIVSTNIWWFIVMYPIFSCPLICKYIYIHMYVIYLCVSVCLYVCMPVCQTVSLYFCMSACPYVCMCVCPYVCMCVCLYVCRSACIHACMHAWMHGCMDGWRYGYMDLWM